MVSSCLEGTQLLDVVKAIVSGRIGQAVKAAVDLPFVVVDADVKGIEGPKHAVDGPDLCRHGLDRPLGQGLAWARNFKAVESAILVTDDHPPLSIEAEIDPRTLLDSRHGVEEFDLESIGCRDSVERGGLVLVNGWAHLPRSLRLQRFNSETQ